VTDSPTGRPYCKPATVKQVARAVTKLCRLVGDLVKGGKNVVCKLNFCDGCGASNRQADTEGNDALLTEWSVENTVST